MRAVPILQQYLSAPLYLVGGAVRNELLGLPVTDIDVCSSLPALTVKEQLGDAFVVRDVNPRIGTVKIVSGEHYYEYTQFRRDSYPVSSGAHRPLEVEFVASPEEDAFRRDFTVNALYKRVSDGVILDPTGGIADLKKKILRTTRKAEEVFSEDGLRLLRLVRFAAELGFEIEEATFRAAKKYASLLADISPERIRDEFMKILVADVKYGTENAVFRGLELCRELGLFAYFLPELPEGIGVTQKSAYHKYDVYYHTLHTVVAAPPHLRLAAVLHDIGKPLCMRRDGNMHEHSLESAILTERIMTRLRFPKKEIARTREIVRWHMFDFNGQASENKKRQFVVREWDYLEDIVALKNADSVGTGYFTENEFGNYLLTLKERLKAEGVPTSVRELPIGGEDLVRLGVPEERRAVVLRTLVERLAIEGARRDRESALTEAMRIWKETEEKG